MTMATILALNVAAIAGLLALLAATMRLPYHLPSFPRSGSTASRVGRRPRKASPASRPSRRAGGAPEPVYSR